MEAQREWRAPRRCVFGVCINRCSASHLLVCVHLSLVRCPQALTVLSPDYQVLGIHRRMGDLAMHGKEKD